MKISEAIKELESIKEKFGDYDLKIYEGFFLTGRIYFDVQNDAPIVIAKFNHKNFLSET